MDKSEYWTDSWWNQQSYEYLARLPFVPTMQDRWKIYERLMRKPVQDKMGDIVGYIGDVGFIGNQTIEITVRGPLRLVNCYEVHHDIDFSFLNNAESGEKRDAG